MATPVLICRFLQAFSVFVKSPCFLNGGWSGKKVGLWAWGSKLVDHATAILLLLRCCRNWGAFCPFCFVYPQGGAADEVSGQWWQVVTAVHYISSRHARSKTLWLTSHEVETALKVLVLVIAVRRWWDHCLACTWVSLDVVHGIPELMRNLACLVQLKLWSFFFRTYATKRTRSLFGGVRRPWVRSTCKWRHLSLWLWGVSWTMFQPRGRRFFCFVCMEWFGKWYLNTCTLILCSYSHH